MVTEKKPKEESGKPKESIISLEINISGLRIGEWSRPLCSQPQVRKLMEPKPVAGEDHTDWVLPDDRKNFNKTELFFTYVYAMLHAIMIYCDILCRT